MDSCNLNCFMSPSMAVPEMTILNVAIERELNAVDRYSPLANYSGDRGDFIAKPLEPAFTETVVRRQALSE